MAAQALRAQALALGVPALGAPRARAQDSWDSAACAGRRGVAWPERGWHSQRPTGHTHSRQAPVISCSSAPSPETRGTTSAAAAASGEPAGLGGLEGALGMGATSDDRKALLHEAMRRLSEEGLEQAAQKYNLEEELFAELDFARINAFSLDPFGGNPAAVVYLPYMPPDTWLQKVAAEFNLSETAYLVRRRPSKAGPLQMNATGDSLEPVASKSSRSLLGNEFDLRWFTPVSEVKLCGHATLASAHLLFTAGLVEPNCDSITFHTLSGQLAARRVPTEDSILAPVEEGQGGGAKQSKKGRGKGGAAAAGKRKGRGIVELSFPLLPLTPLEQSDWPGLEAALRLPAGAVRWAARNSLHYIMVELGSQEEVLSVEPDMGAVAQIPAVAVMVTALTHKHTGGEQGGSTEGSSTSPRAEALARADFVTRFFAPQVGIDEDPVTGSAFCSLGPHWAGRLGRTELVGLQASERGGEVAVLVDEAEQRVHLQGWAVMVQAGVLLNTMGP